MNYIDIDNYLYIKEVKTVWDVVLLVGPFINKILSIITYTTPLELYKHIPKTTAQQYIKMAIDSFSFFTIISSINREIKMYGTHSGIMKAVALLTFSFFIPTLYLYKFMGSSKSLLKGMFIIYLLYFCEHYIIFYYREYIENKQHKDKPIKDNIS